MLLLCPHFEGRIEEKSYSKRKSSLLPLAQSYLLSDEVVALTGERGR